jgi:hypothetical protein
MSEIPEKSPQHFEGNTTMSTFSHSQSVQPLPWLRIAVTSCCDYPHGLYTLVTVGADNHLIIRPNLGKPLFKICDLNFFHISGSNAKTLSWYWLALQRYSSKYTKREKVPGSHHQPCKYGKGCEGPKPQNSHKLGAAEALQLELLEPEYPEPLLLNCPSE